MTAVFFHAKPFADAIASVTNAALSFLMCHKILSVNFFDLHHGQLLAMTDGLMIAFAAFHLERDLLFSALVFNNIGGNGGSRNYRSANIHLALVVHEQNTVKSVGLTR